MSDVIGKDYSQFGEYGEFLSKFPWDKERLVVDVGACSVQDSNSYNLLLQDGFRGLLIEPIEYRRVQREFLAVIDKVVIEPAAISPIPGLFPMYIHSAIGHHSLLPKWIPETATKQIEMVRAYTLPEVLDKHQVPHSFAFLSIDTEGLDALIVLQMLIASPYRPTVIMMEKGETSFRLDRCDWGYSLQYENAYNAIYVRR